MWLERLNDPNFPADEWSPWVIHQDVWSKLARSRRMQLEYDLPEKGDDSSITLPQSTINGPSLQACHPLYLQAAQIKSKRLRCVWLDALQFLTAVTGSERLLDDMERNPLGAIEYVDKRKLRAQVPMPVWVWEVIDKLRRWVRLSNSGREEVKRLHDDLRTTFGNLFSQKEIHLRDEFLRERIDILLNDRTTPEFPCSFSVRAIVPKTLQPEVTVTEPTSERMKVRIAQLTAKPDWPTLPQRFPRLTRKETKNILGDLMLAFASRQEASTPLVILPEVFLPPAEIGVLEGICRKSRQAGLVGCLWRIVPSAAPSHVATKLNRWIANDAAFVYPLANRAGTKVDLRTFLICKPNPAHVELAFAKALERQPHVKGNCSILPGRRIYRFVENAWGDFTVGICSDLIDPALWAGLRGQVLHLFACSYNQDIELFESLTCVRAYELLANVVATNCGEYGGSFAWTPKHHHERLLASIKGPNVRVISDIELPVLELFNWQQCGNKDALKSSLKRHWNTPVRGKTPYHFKPPPPGYPGRDPVA